MQKERNFGTNRYELFKSHAEIPIEITSYSVILRSKHLEQVVN